MYTKRILSLILALALFLVGCSKKPENTSSWQSQYDLGIRYLSESNYEEAIIAFTAAIEIDPKQADAFMGRAQAYVASGETEENLAAALADYEEAIALDEINTDAWLGLADTYIRLGDYEKAIELLRSALDKTAQDTLIAEKIAELESSVSESAPQVQTEEYDFQAQVTANGMDVDAEYLSVRVRDARTATITVSGLSLQDNYLTNLSTSTKDVAEYMWEVRMCSALEEYSVSTSCWAFEPGREDTMPITGMQHSTWVYDGDSFQFIGDAAMSYTDDNITWTFTIPEEYPFNFAQIDRYEVSIVDISQNLDVRRIYTIS